MTQVREVLRAWLAGAGKRPAARRAGVDVKTAARYIRAAQAAGLARDGDESQLSDELLGAVVGAVRPARPAGHGESWEALAARKSGITAWVKEGLTLVKMHELLERSGTAVPYRTLARFAAEECGYSSSSRPGVTVPVADGKPGEEVQLDFGYLGMISDGDRRRKLHALVFTAVVSRYCFVYLTFSQTTAAVIAGCEAAWAFFGGMFAVLIPDNLKPVVDKADRLEPRWNREWLEYAQARGLVVDPARVRSPQDKGRVENGVKFAQRSFFAGEDFNGIGDAQRRADDWCRIRAGMRVHGTTRRRPAEVFAQVEVPALLPVPEQPYRVPAWSEAKVQRDFHLLTELAKMFPQVTRHFADRCAMVAVRDRGRGCDAGPGRAGRARCGVAAGDRQRVGAVPAHRPGRGRSNGGVGVVRGSAGRRPVAGHAAVLRHGPAAVVPVPLGGPG
ncbi:MAG: IS21 family transposase [Streptosporangiales bacterium]